MAERGYQACIVPRADEYLGEYLPPCNERLRWLTGFTGSAGMAVVTASTAALFIDGRYTVQVRSQVEPAHFSFHHLIEEPACDWLCEQLQAGDRVACDPRLHAWQWFCDARDQLQRAQIALVADADNMIDRCWQGRPVPERPPALLLDEAFTGESSAAKRQRIAGQVIGAGCDGALLFAPDSVSWLLNVRGRDMPQLPVVLSFALLHGDGSTDLFTRPDQIPSAFDAHVGAGVRVHPESAFGGVLSGLAGRKILADAQTASAWTHLELQRAGVEVVAGDDPVLLPKACKNPVELAGSAAAHRRDAVAEIRFLAWLDSEVQAGRLHDEATLAQHLHAERARLAHFHAPSFDTISAAGANAAMCHYNHQDAVPAQLPMNSVYLVDSGGQYLDGTTDITRTVAIGDPGETVRRLFTLVLKGHIALDRARFPHGTTGMQLDTLARQYLWQEGFDFDHGTGHGVGVFLSVHEGPQRISKISAVALAPGMIVSNEPGYYRAGEFGIRCENLLVVRESDTLETEVPMLCFEALTLVPFDTRLLQLDLLRADEVRWLNDYHARVAREIAPLLEGPPADWLSAATQPITH